MDTSYLREKANCLRNEMNHLWTGTFVTCGGAIGFSVFEPKNILVIIYIVLGIFLTTIFINGYMVRRNQLTQIENFYSILTNILGFTICGILLYFAYAFHKQDKEFAKHEKN